ncbi:MAG: hypothetical protein OEQ24_08095 [Gammaproteobacteria bacterium]|nr:hypothetical protein [Gammaproteobacteria bacterium]
MKTKAIITLALLLTSGITLASGRSINNIDVSNIKPTEVEITEIKAQGPTDAFNVTVKSNDKEKVDTSKLKQAYDGRS